MSVGLFPEVEERDQNRGKVGALLTASGRYIGGEGRKPHSPGTGIERFCLPANEIICLL